jgi:serine O-acetyltransferase
MEKKMGFDAYGLTQDMPDPVSNAINGILDHIHVMDERLIQTSIAVKKLGGEVEDFGLPEIKAEDMEGVTDQVEVATEGDTKEQS